MKKSRLAVSIVLTCKDEVFTIIRRKYLKAFPGYTAFPGGKVEKSDGASDDLEKTLFETLCREAREELDIDIKSLQEENIIISIDKIARAKSPSFNPYIFDTYFYRVEFKDKPKLKLDKNEMMAGTWSKPELIVNEYNQGERILIYPIRKVLEKLAGDINFNEFLDYSNRDEEMGDIPYIEPVKGFLQLMPSSNTLPPASRTNAFLIGDQKKCLIDPSPRDESELKSLLRVLKKFDIDKIIITHHHGDHHEYAPDIAKELNLPIYISQDSHERCMRKFGKEYFKNSQIHYLEDGDIVTSWLGHDVITIAVPGHDEGQMAFMPSNKAWCIVGDLFQGIGTVVVGGEEGDMQKYFASLKKIIELAPNAVVPSHGIMLGGVHILEKTLKHREMREAQVLELMNNGNSIDEVLEKIYFDIPKKLLPYAKANIESHITKLKKEGHL